MTKKAAGLPARGSTSGRPTMVPFDVLGQRWTPRILRELPPGPLPFQELVIELDRWAQHWATRQ